MPTPRKRALYVTWLEAELAIIRPALVIPVGRHTIEQLVSGAPLDRLVGRAHAVAGGSGQPTSAIPMPHPSGASTWIHAPGHAVLLAAALALLAGELARLGLADVAVEDAAGRAAGRSVA